MGGAGHQAGCEVEGRFPRGVHRHAQYAFVHQQAPVLRPWASPGHSAEEFRRRAGLRSRGLKSRARVRIEWLLISLPDIEPLSVHLHVHGSGGEARWEEKSHGVESENVTTLEDFPKFSKMSGAAAPGSK